MNTFLFASYEKYASQNLDTRAWQNHSNTVMFATVGELPFLKSDTII